MEFLFRADATPTMGTGHAMRCLALAEALIALGHPCHFAMAETTGSIERRLANAAIALYRVDPALDRAASMTRDLAYAVGAAGLVVDGYHFDADWRLALRRSARPVLGFSDRVDDKPLHADLVVDAAADPDHAVLRDEAVQWLLGPAYVLLRRELVEAARRPMLPIADRPAVLVIFGGSDPAGLTLPVVTVLTAALGSAVTLDVVIGGGVPDADEVQDRVVGLGAQIRIHRDPPALGRLMQRAGLAVSAAGGTIGELAALGVPAIIATVAENQIHGAAAAAASGWCEAVDGLAPDAAAQIAASAVRLWADPLDRARRADRARLVVDPGGAQRLAAALIERAGRPATLE